MISDKILKAATVFAILLSILFFIFGFIAGTTYSEHDPGLTGEQEYMLGKIFRP